MSQTKTVKTRIQHKHDIEANWIKATNFVPLAGELIIYDAETASTDLTGTGRTSPITQARFKFGDGKTIVNDLAFSSLITDKNKIGLDYLPNELVRGEDLIYGGAINSYNEFFPNCDATNAFGMLLLDSQEIQDDGGYILYDDFGVGTYGGNYNYEDVIKEGFYFEKEAEDGGVIKVARVGNQWQEVDAPRRVEVVNTINGQSGDVTISSLTHGGYLEYWGDACGSFGYWHITDHYEGYNGSVNEDAPEIAMDYDDQATKIPEGTFFVFKSGYDFYDTNYDEQYDIISTSFAGYEITIGDILYVKNGKWQKIDSCSSSIYRDLNHKLDKVPNGIDPIFNENNTIDINYLPSELIKNNYVADNYKHGGSIYWYYDASTTFSGYGAWALNDTVELYKDLNLDSSYQWEQMFIDTTSSTPKLECVGYIYEWSEEDQMSFPTQESVVSVNIPENYFFTATIDDWERDDYDVASIGGYDPNENDTLIVKNGQWTLQQGGIEREVAVVNTVNGQSGDVVITTVMDAGLTQKSVTSDNITCTAGAKGFYIANIDTNAKEIYLCNTSTKPTQDDYGNGQSWAPAVHDTDFTAANGYSIGDKFTIYNGKSYPYCGTISSINCNVIQYEEETLPCSEFKIETSADGTPWRNWDADHILYVPSKPDVGYILTYFENDTTNQMWQGAAVFGTDNKASGEGDVVGGTKNIAIDDHTAIFGYKNIGAYGSIIGGACNNITGTYNLVCGNSNTATSKKSSYNIIGGKKHIVNSSYSLIQGSENKDYGTYENFILGEYNEITTPATATEQRCSAIFGKSNKSENSYTFTGGFSNTNDSQYSTVYGYKNEVKYAECNTVSGAKNTVYSGYSNVSGESNSTNGSHHAVSGKENTVNGKYNNVSGYKNTVSAGDFHIVAGGSNNICGTYNNVSGKGHNVSSSYSFVTGATNTDSGLYQNFIAGQNNRITGGRQTTVFGESNTVNGDYKFVCGTYAEDAANLRFIVGNGYFNNTTKKAVLQNAFSISDAGAVAIGSKVASTTNTPQVIIGKYNADTTNAAIVVAQGKSETERKNTVVIRNDGSIFAGTDIDTYTDLGGSGNAGLGIFNCYDQPASISGNSNLLHGDMSNCQVTGNYNAVLGSGGNNKITTQHNLVVGAGHTVGGTLHESGEANLLVGVSHDVNGANYSGFIGSGLTGSVTNQLIIGEYNKDDTDAAFVVGAGDRFGNSKLVAESSPYIEMQAFNEHTLSFEGLLRDADIPSPNTSSWYSIDECIIYHDGTEWVASGKMPYGLSFIGKTTEGLSFRSSTYNTYYVKEWQSDIEKITVNVPVSADADYYVGHFGDNPKQSIHVYKDINNKWYQSPTDALNHLNQVETTSTGFTITISFKILTFALPAEELSIRGTYKFYAVKPSRKNVFSISKDGKTNISNKLTVSGETIINGDITAHKANLYSTTVDGTFTALGAANMSRINIQDTRGGSVANTVTRNNIVIGRDNTTLRGNGNSTGSEHITASLLVGQGLQGSSYYQTVLGKYNDAANDPIDVPLIIGWGDKTAKKTVLVVNADGRVTTAGKDPEQDFDLITKKYLDSRVPSNLLKYNKKINETYLPDVILGQMKFGGIITANAGNGFVGDFRDVHTISPSDSLRSLFNGSDVYSFGIPLDNEAGSAKLAISYTNGDFTAISIPEGYYFISNVDSRIEDAHIQLDTPFYKGDWLVVADGIWRIVDNTDAVRTVNGKIGNIELDAEAVGAYSKEYVDELESRIITLENIINNITTLNVSNTSGQLKINE